VPISHTTRRPQAQAIICGPNHPERAEFEAFVQDGFQRKHGAVVHSFMPVLLGLRDLAGRLVGVAGYRPAGGGRLYLEQYLPTRIENIIAAREPWRDVRRDDIAEIGNFAARDCATAMKLVDLLAGFLNAQGHQWVVFTATRTVRGIMRHLGIHLAEIARADKSRVVVANDDWGKYYSTDPRVMLAYIPAYRGQPSDLTWSI
jgi:hypothetical protein